MAIHLRRSAETLQADFEPLIERHGLYGPAYNVLWILRGEGEALPWGEVSSRFDVPVIDLHRGQLAHLSPGEFAEFNQLLVKARRQHH